jgi:hypothetical protein
MMLNNKIVLVVMAIGHTNVYRQKLWTHNVILKFVGDGHTNVIKKTVIQAIGGQKQFSHHRKV